MNKRILSIIVVIGCVLSGTSAPAQPPALRLIVPSKKTLSTYASQYRLAGNTQPGNTIIINGKEIQVYSTGAFAHLVSLKEGKNNITITTVNKENEKTEEKIVIHRHAGLKDTPERKIVIEEALLLPSVDYELADGDILKVRFKGTPGLEASFSLGSLVRNQPMAELPTEIAPDNLKGIYVGHYRVKPEDHIKAQPVTFLLEKNFLQRRTKKTSAKVSVRPDAFPLTGITTEKTYLKTSLGTARLGGAELGTLEENVLLTVNGRIGELYRVLLGDSDVAWVSRDSVRLLPQPVLLPRSLINSISVTSDDTHDIISLATGKRIPYSVNQTVDPVGLEVKIYNALSNITWITNRETENIDDVSWEQIDVRTLKLKVTLKTPLLWGYHVGYEGARDTFEIKLRHCPQFASGSSSPLKGLRIALDAGHGGSSYGAVEASGVAEKVINRATADALSPLLEKVGAFVIDLRPGDSTVSIADRIETALSTDADLFLSIHANSISETSDPFASAGTMVLYKHPKDRELANALYRNILETGIKGAGVISSFNAATVKITDMNTVLVEQGFLSNPEEEALLLDPAFRKKMAQEIFEGLEEFYDSRREKFLKK